MAQFDFGNLESPLSGTVFINSNLEPWRDALHSSHKGGSRPSYAVEGMMWVNDTTNPWVLNMFDGANDIAIGTFNTTTNTFSPSGVSSAAEDISFDNTDSGLTATNVQDAIDEAVSDFSDFEGRVAGFATAAQGALADTAVQPSDLPPAWNFTSSNQSFTNGGTVTVAHGLGAVPSDISAYLKCTTAQSPFSVGDLIPLNYGVSTFNGAGNWVGVVMFKANATNLVLEVSNNGFYYQNTALTASNFRIIVKAKE